MSFITDEPNDYAYRHLARAVFARALGDLDAAVNIDTPELRQNAYVKGRSFFLKGQRAANPRARLVWEQNAERRQKIADGLTAAYFLLSPEPTPWHLIAGLKPEEVIARVPAQWKAWALAQTQVRYKAS